MCGILGVLNFDGRAVDRDLFLRMRDTMFHRGPDGEGVHVDGPVGLGHRRLAIIDLTPSGAQPMGNEDGSVQVVFNGEIYNYVELRQELAAKGHALASTSDTETILHQYEEDGDRCVEKLNGMFGFVLWDARRRRLLAARDRIGIKPLYYYADERRLIVASEIKAILEDPAVPRAAEPTAIYDYVFAGRCLDDRTMFRGIREVPPGHILTADASGRVETKQYWDVAYCYDHRRSAQATTEALRALVDDAVKVHCRSDASVGCHLSGGLDSSTVTALAARYRKGLKAFSMRFSEERDIDESAFAKSVAAHVGATYVEGTSSGRQLARLLPILVWHMDQPMAASGGFSYFTVSHVAHRHVKVTLTGHGGDEIFAGYPAQFHAAFDRTDMFAPSPVGPRRPPRSMTTRLRDAVRGKTAGDLVRAAARRVTRPEQSLEARWLQLHCNLVKPRAMFGQSFLRSIGEYSPADAYLRPLRDVQTDQLLDRCLYHDLRVYLPGLLHLEDRASMALSIESRVPLLDFRIVEFLATVPPEQKIDGFVPKHLLRQVAAPLLPEQVWQRKDKFPFPVPRRYWDEEESRALCDDLLASPQSRERGIFQPWLLDRALGDSDLAWPLLNVELWFRIFIDRDPRWVAAGLLDPRA
jgi:asparagine synthase (glutamine-hydrolysing)